MPGPSIILADTRYDELPAIHDMEHGDARPFVMPYSLSRHQQEFAEPDVAYKSIHLGGDLIGFVILVLDADEKSVEFRRIVVARPGQGVGRQVMDLIDDVCARKLYRQRIWLDVFESNRRAQHVYEQSGYKIFGRKPFQGQTMLLYEKWLAKDQPRGPRR